MTPDPAWYVVMVTTAAQMVVAMSNTVLSTIAPKVAESLAIDPVLIGYQVGLTFAAAAVASAYGGVVAMRLGSALTTQLSMVVCLVGLALFALPHVGFIALGISSVGWNGIVHAECARLSPPGMVSLVAGGTSFFVFAGVMLGPTVFAAMYPVIGTYGATFSLTVVAGVAALVLLILALRRQP